MKILMMGPQGCGKGTIGKLLSEGLGTPLISTGEVLRELPHDSSLYKEMDSYMSRGLLAPNDLLAKILKEKVAGMESYILDGWGRQKSDLAFFDPGFDQVIYLTISKETSLKRLSTRRTCNNCGEIYNIVTKKPKIEGICDLCGGALVQRNDDKEEAIAERLEIFNKETLPVIDYFRQKGLLVELNGEGSPQEVLNAYKR